MGKSIYLQFTLTMPNVGSWNNKWTGADRLYARVINFSKMYGNSDASRTKLNQLLETENYWYNFGDGWTAMITVRQIDGNTKRKVDKLTRGFYQYDWMIYSILSENEILTDMDRKQKHLDNRKGKENDDTKIS